MDNELLSHVIEIKERISSIETKLESQPEVAQRLRAVESEVAQIQSSAKTFKWLLGIVVALVAAALKTLKN